MALILDVLVVGIFIYVVYSNAKRGFCKVFVFGIGYLVATLLASALAALGAPAFYEGIARDMNVSTVESVNSHVDFPTIFADAINAQEYGQKIQSFQLKKVLADYDNGEFDERLYEYTISVCGKDLVSKGSFMQVIQKAFVSGYGEVLRERLPEYVYQSFATHVDDNPQLMRDMVREYYDYHNSDTERADKIEALYSAEPTTEVIQIFIFLILFSVFMVIAAIIASIVQQKVFININKATDHFAGGVIGLLEAGSVLILLTLVVRLIVMLSGGKFLFFNDAALDNTFLFSFLYRNIRILL